MTISDTPAEPSSDTPLPVTFPEPDAPVRSTPAFLSFPRALRVTLFSAVPFALVGLLVGLRVVAQATLPHIVQPGEYLNFQDVTDGLPVPRLLAWDVGRIETLSSLRELSGFSLLLAATFVFGPLWLFAVRHVNPTFRFFSQKAEEQEANGQKTDGKKADSRKLDVAAPLEFYGLIKAATLTLILGLPLAAVWILVDGDDRSAPPVPPGMMAVSNGPLIGNIWLMRLVLLGIVFWLGFDRDGIGGDFTQPEWNRSRRLVALAGRGALFGLLAFAFCRYGLPQHLEGALIRLQTLGALNIALWKWFAAHCLLCFAGAWAATGALFALFSRRDIAPRHRFLLTLAPLAFCGVALVSLQAFTPRFLAAHYDVRPAVMRTMRENGEYRPDLPGSGIPDTPQTALEMARELHLSVGPQKGRPARTLILFDQNLPVLARQNGYTTDGLSPDEVSAKLTTDFLRKRDYKTAFSWTAMKNLYNVPLLQFDTTGSLTLGLEDLTHCPHNLRFSRALLQTFSVCAATPQNEALLDQWADETQFAFPDRDSRRLMGDLYRRMGDADKALRWYRKADMPASFLKRVQAERIMFHDGRIDGVLNLNGRPLAGAQVAVVPRLMNGLPKGLAEIVKFAWVEMLNSDPRQADDLFPYLHTQPYSLRWLSAAATTDSQGAYHIAHLTDGAYLVLCALPPDTQVRLPQDDRLQISHPPRSFTVNYKHPTRDMGTTEITFKQ